MASGAVARARERGEHVSERQPERPLEYESQTKREVAGIGSFIGSALLWAILAPGLVVGLGLGGAAVTGGNPIAIGVGAVIGVTVIVVVLRNALRRGDPRRRGSRLAGALTGIGISLLLVGGCFASLSNLKL